MKLPYPQWFAWAAAVTLAVVLSACGTAGTSSGATSSSNPGDAGPITGTNPGGTSPPNPGNPSATTEVTMASPGIVSLDCNTQALDLLEPTTGAVLATTPALPADYSYTFGTEGLTESPLPCEGLYPADGELPQTPGALTFYSPNYSLMIVDIQAADGTTDAGYIDIASGAVTDIGRQLQSQAFSASAANSTAQGFDSKGNFYLTTAGSHGNSNWYEVPAGETSLEALTQPPTVSYATSPGGAYQVEQQTLEEEPTFGYSGPELYVSEKGGSFLPLVDPTSTDNPSIEDQAIEGCDQLFWLNGDTLLCAQAPSAPTVIIDLSGAQQVTTKVTGSDASGLAVTAQSLLPSNTKSNYGFVLSPDGSKLAFASEVGQTLTAYEMAPQAGATPTELFSVPYESQLIAWQG
jgi:hypothetical protein